MSGADPNAFGNYGTYLVFDPLSLDPGAAALDLAGVRYLAAPPGAGSPIGPQVEDRDAAPFHPPGALDRPHRDVRGGQFPRVYAGPDLTIFERPTALPRFRLEGPGTVRTLALEPERFTVETEAPIAVTLATAQKVLAPYWRVSLDGREIAVAAEGPFLALEVPAGTHRIEGRFRVPRRELAVSLLGLAALSAAIIAASRRRPGPQTG